MSRPEIPIDWKKVDEMLIDGCLGTEVAAYFGMHPDTFYNRVQAQFGIGFTEYSCQKKSKGDGALRQAQMKKALKGDNTMLIWLGKQRLGQKENASQNVTSEDIMNAFSALMTQIQEAQRTKIEVKEPAVVGAPPQPVPSISSSLPDRIARLSVFQ